MPDIQFLSQLLKAFPNFADHVSSVFGPQAAASVQQSAANAAGGGTVITGPGHVTPPGGLGTVQPSAVGTPAPAPTPAPIGPGVQLPIASPQLPGGSLGAALAPSRAQTPNFNSQLSAALSGSRPQALPR